MVIMIMLMMMIMIIIRNNNNAQGHVGTGPPAHLPQGRPPKPAEAGDSSAFSPLTFSRPHN